MLIITYGFVSFDGKANNGEKVLQKRPFDSMKRINVVIRVDHTTHVQRSENLGPPCDLRH